MLRSFQIYHTIDQLYRFDQAFTQIYRSTTFLAQGFRSLCFFTQSSLKVKKTSLYLFNIVFWWFTLARPRRKEVLMSLAWYFFIFLCFIQVTWEDKFFFVVIYSISSLCYTELTFSYWFSLQNCFEVIFSAFFKSLKKETRILSDLLLFTLWWVLQQPEGGEKNFVFTSLYPFCLFIVKENRF